MRLDPKRIAVPTALGGVLLIAYWNSFDGSFHYDDFHSILHNPHIRDLGNLPAFFLEPSLFSVDADKAMYRPLLLVSYALNFAWGGYEESGYHLVNLLLHCGSSLLVWQIAGISGCGRRAAAFAGLIFALHPLASEPVNYISSRSELLGALLFLGAFRWFLLGTPRSRIVAVVLFAMGLLSKEMVVTLPLVLWLHQSWVAGGVGPRLRQHLAMWLVAAAYLGALLLSGSLARSMAVIEANRLTEISAAAVMEVMGEQVWTQVKAASFYLELLLFPVAQNVEHQFSSAPSFWNWAVLASGALLLSAAGLCWRCLRRDQAFWLVWPAITIAPATLVPLNVLVNEHRMYLPLVGAAILAARIWPGLRRRAPVAAVVLLTGLAALTVARNAVWRDELSLWRDSVEKSPYMSRSHVHFGNALRERGHSEEAEREYERALQLEPSHRSARTNLANLYYERGWSAPDSSLARRLFLRAVSDYNRVLEMDPEYKEALNNAGNAYVMLGEPGAAADAFERAITAHPLFGEAYYNLGHLYVAQGRSAEAVGPLETALSLYVDGQSSWREADARWDLGNAYAGAGRLSEAVDAYRLARSSNRKDPRYARNLGEVLFALGERALATGDSSAAGRLWEEARSCYRQLMELGGDRERAAYRLEQMETRLP